jgi:thioredoxin-like negative regulator of GroEL
MLAMRGFLAAATVAVVLSVMSAHAITQKFDQKSFEAAQEAGKPILIEIHAAWCPVCARQQPILTKLGADPKFKELVSFQLDFDTEMQTWRKFNVRQQSTLIVFKGKKEVGRSVGDTNPKSIEALLAKSL